MLSIGATVVCLVRGAATAVWLLVNVLVLLVYEAATCTIRPISRSAFRRAVGRCFAIYVEIMAWCFPPCDLVVSGELPSDVTKPIFLICNHQVDADWWYISELMRYVGGAGNLKIAMKHTLRSIPLLGVGMDMMDFLFLHRDIKIDRPRIQAYMQSFVQDNFPFWMLLFPEGTTIFTEYVAKSHAFAENANRPLLHRVVLPRSTGLKLMLDAFKDSPVQPEIYDLTMAFPGYKGEVPTSDMNYDRHVDVEVPNMKKLLMGRGSKKVHFHVRRFRLADVGPDVEAFLDRLWLDKEALMNEFIEFQCFPSQKDTTRVLRPTASLTSIAQLWFSGALSICLLPMLFPCYVVATSMRKAFGGAKISSHSTYTPMFRAFVLSTAVSFSVSPAPATMVARPMAASRPPKQATARPPGARGRKVTAPPNSSKSTSTEIPAAAASAYTPTIKVSVRNLRLRRGGVITYNLKMVKCPTSSQTLVVSVVLPGNLVGITVSPTEVVFTRQNYRHTQAVTLQASDSTQLYRFTIQHVLQSRSSLSETTNLAAATATPESLPPVTVQVLQKQSLFMFAFGSGVYGQLGVSNRFDKRDATAFTPTPLGSKWLIPAQVACGGAHTAVIDVNSHLYCFGIGVIVTCLIHAGRGMEGQLGQPHLDNVKVPSVVPKLMNMLVTHVACGANHTMCLVHTTAFAWGDNSSGQLGLNMKAKHHPVPHKVHHLHYVHKLVCAGDHSFAIVAGGDVYATGSNIAGQLGFGDTTSRSAFTRNPALVNIHSITSGVYHVVAHSKAPLSVFVWGCGGNGRLGLGHVETVTTPTPLEEFRGTRVLQMAAGGAHTALVTEAGDLLMWGANTYGQIGDGLASDRLTPHRLRMFQGKFIKSIALGEWHSVALVDDACVYAWGFGEEGQLGLGEDQSTSLPMVVVPLSGTSPLNVCCGAAHTVVVTALEAACRMQQEKDQMFSARAAMQERRHLSWRKSMLWKGKHPDRKRGIDMNRFLMASSTRDAAPATAPASRRRPLGAPTRRPTPTTKPRRPQTARPFRDAIDDDDTSDSAHVIPWRERPMTSRTSLRNALRQEFHALSLLQKHVPASASIHTSVVFDVLARKEAALKANAAGDPFQEALRGPTTPPPGRRRQQRPQTAPSRNRIQGTTTTERGTTPSETKEVLAHDDSLAKLLDDDFDDDDAIDDELASEMQLGWETWTRKRQC
ncbi:Aste57867_13905 [Aphanomyces stellatus]|uniref:Aste57867_13905 protein n=1 Tax=Aphanomyces stellatus TaxID=120398 RepID=A0A485KZU2_9STRA|nr:hypothetical protein As57867_013854 [Aphanomyces stellatus]VFT90736.1 Aste57867_13905 [Aphanomyces stellatus]